MRTELTCWPEVFNRIASGRKTGDIREKRHSFQEGDEIIYREFNPGTQEFTGNTAIALIRKVHDVDMIKNTRVPNVMLHIRVLSTSIKGAPV